MSESNRLENYTTVSQQQIFFFSTPPPPPKTAALVYILQLILYFISLGVIIYLLSSKIIKWKGERKRERKTETDILRDER